MMRLIDLAYAVAIAAAYLAIVTLLHEVTT